MKTSLFRCFWGLVFTLLCLPDIAFAAPPSITDQPTNQTVAVGGTAVFSVTARGRAPMYYQWNLNETNPLVGATNTTLTLTNVQSANAGAYSVTVTNLSGSVTSSNAVLTVLTPPSITLQPAGCTNVAGTTASFTVAADGATPLSYQWRKNGSGLTDGGNVSGAATTDLTLSNVQDADAASYTVVVTNIVGSITSAPAVLAVVDPPTITTQPTNQTVWAGSNATFNVAASGTPPLSYQWQFNGININGSTNTSLILTNVQVAQAGNYAALVTNAAGFILSSNAVLTVAKSGPVLVCDEVDLQAAVAAGGTITFGCDGVITLTKTLTINTDTTLDGTGHTVTISGGNAIQLSSVNSGVSASFINLTLANGYAAGSNGTASTDGQPGTGGAILNNGGTVALTGCTVISNNAVGGAGFTNTGTAPYTGTAGGAGLGGVICNLSGNLSMTNCSFVANGATGGAGGYGQNGGGAGGAACGGAIYSLGGNVVVQNSAFVLHVTKGGSAGYDGAAISASAGSAFGGVIYSTNATVNFNNSTFTSNSVTGTDTTGVFGAGGSGAGGVIFAQSGVVNCIGCAFATNTAAGGHAFKSYAPGSASGGAICSYASLSVSQSSFWGNRASGNAGGWAVGAGNGGAIFNGNSLSLSDNTFVQNAVVGGNGMYLLAGGNTPGGPGQGGAICNQGTLAATNCSFAKNAANGGASGNAYPYSPGSGGDGAGGGLFNSGTATLVNLTFATNNAIGGTGTIDPTHAYPPGATGLSLGGGICNTNGTVNLYNTIMAYSSSGSNCWGTVLDQGHNLSSDASAGFSAPGSLNNTDPILGPLGNYGGPTLTLPLLTGSPAIDGGNTAIAPPTDQRGHARPYGAAADIGAFESSPPFFIGGQVSGQTLRDEVTMVIGSSNLVTTNLGSYGVSAFAAGSYTVTPTSPNYLFIPANRPLTVGPDQLDINFKAYHWNALSLEAVTNGVIHCLIADTNGLTCRVLTSTNLAEWSPVSTNVVGPGNYFEVFLPITGEPMRYYRTAIP